MRQPVFYAICGVLAGAVVAGLAVGWLYAQRIKRERHEAALRMEKLERVRSTFVANVTHELKTPLTSIKGYMELLHAAARDEEMRNSFYDIIDIEVERLQALIEDLLQLSEIEHSREGVLQQECNLYELGQEALKSFRPLAEQAGVLLDVYIPQGLRVRGNSQRLGQLVNNLVDNAIKYNHNGGSVHLRAWQEEGKVALTVSDTGIGIADEHAPHIFERFYRVDKGRSRAMGGTGLGLSIVKHVVQLHGGSIQLKSQPGQGSVFLVYLPGCPPGAE